MKEEMETEKKIRTDRPYHTHRCRCGREIAHHSAKHPDGWCTDPDRSLCHKCLAKSFRVHYVESRSMDSYGS